MFAALHCVQILGDAPSGVSTFTRVSEDYAAGIAQVVIAVFAPRSFAIALRIYHHDCIAVLASECGGFKEAPTGPKWQSGSHSHRIGYPGGFPVVKDKKSFVGSFGTHMNIWPYVGIGVATSLAPLAQQYVVQPIVKACERIPFRWLRRILLFRIGY